MTPPRVGLFLTNQQVLGADLTVALGEQLEMLRAARDAGWDSVFAGQHYLAAGMSHIQPVPFLARLAAEAGDMHLGVGITLLALHNPVEVAENYAALDVISGGRLIFGVGLGYREVEFNAFGIDPGDKVARLRANLDVIRRLWAGEAVTVDLPWCRLENAVLNYRPVQQPGPPIWMAANSDGAVRRAARLSDAWMINPHATRDTLRRQIALYRRTREEAGTGPGAGLPLMREVFCAPDRRQALELAAPHLGAKYDAYASWGQDQVMADDDTFDRAYEELAANRFVIGDPEDVLESLLPWRDEFGVDHFILRTHWAGMPAEAALASQSLLSREVLPILRGR